MIPMTSILLLAISLSVVFAARRRVPFVNCPSAKSNSSLTTTKPARSRIECSVTCLNDQDCLSASYCKTSDGYTCQLSGVYTSGGCSGLGTDGGCTLTAIENPCDNGGTFIPENRTCHCAEGFVGSYCQRRYRDCVETPNGNNEYLIHPFGSDTIFAWPCNYDSLSVTEFLFTVTYNTTHTWHELKQGLPPKIDSFFFIGLERLHQLTKQGRYDMYVSLFILGKEMGIVWYRNIRVDSEADGYALHWDYFERDADPLFSSPIFQDAFGGSGDATKNVNGARFGTVDDDINECAKSKNIGWWYNPVGCMVMDIATNGMYWPVKRNQTIENVHMFFSKMGVKAVHFYEEDDLVL